MLSHADLHAQPEEELPGEYRKHVDRIFDVQRRGVRWLGGEPVRYLETHGVTFVRADTRKNVPEGITRAATIGVVGLVSALLGFGYLDEAELLGKALLVIGGICLVGCLWWLVRYPKQRLALMEGPTRRGVYFFGDALVILREPESVIHRPERCGALMIPKGAITALEVVDVHEGDVATYVVALRIRKSTGEFVDKPLSDYATIVRHNPLAALLERWLASG